MMWGMWGTRDETGRPDWVRWAFIAFLVLLVVGLISSRSFSGWWWFFILPMFWGWGSRRRRFSRNSQSAAEREKRKNDEFADDVEFEKPKRAEFRLGDDGELIEVEADEPPLYVERPSARRFKGDDPIEYV
jgi:hypothetical protein